MLLVKMIKICVFLYQSLWIFVTLAMVIGIIFVQIDFVKTLLGCGLAFVGELVMMGININKHNKR